MTYSYTPVTFAGRGPLPGTLHLIAALKALTGCPIGSFNPRCVQQCGLLAKPGARTCPNGHGLSHHAESTAADVMSTDPAIHAKVIEWCLGPWGQAFEVQEIVTGYPPASTGITGPARWVVGQGWRPYRGGPSMHRDHVHLSQTFDAAIRPEPPTLPPEPGDDDMFTLYVPEGFYDVLAVGPKTFKVSTPESVRELVGLGKVTNQVVNGDYDAAAIRVSVQLWSDMAGFAPVSPR